jgi:hypothetical protein
VNLSLPRLTAYSLCCPMYLKGSLYSRLSLAPGKDGHRMIIDGMFVHMALIKYFRFPLGLRSMTETYSNSRLAMGRRRSKVR